MGGGPYLNDPLMAQSLHDPVGVAVLRVLAEHEQQALPRHQRRGAVVAGGVHHVVTFGLLLIRTTDDSNVRKFKNFS